MKDAKDKATSFLKLHGMHYSDIDMDKCCGDFLDEMEKGLAGEKSSLKMIPTHIETDSELPKNLTLTSSEIRDALSEPVSTVVDAVRMALEKTPPELASDIMDRGIVMAGGGSMLRGLDKYISQETDMSVYVVDDPISCVAYGTGKVLEEIDTLKKVLVTTKRGL